MKSLLVIVCSVFGVLGSCAEAQIGPGPVPAKEPKPEPVAQPAEEKLPALPVPTGVAMERRQLESGVVVEDLRMGDGDAITATSHAVVHYQGVLRADGKEFASSYARGEPFAQSFATALKGWREGLPGMKVGGIRRLTIPAALAYAEKGLKRNTDQLELVPPNADVIFTVEIVDSIKVEDIKEGEGEPLSGRFVAVGPFTIKDEAGNVLEKADPDKPYIWVHGEYQPMDLALEGMKAGGHRRITVPRQFALAKGLGKSHPVSKKVVIDFEMMYYRCIDIKD
ncbi:MAG: FKBP-type peptidyl-prolyl cis-trans isomerase [Phycisphaerales bacterium]